MISESRRALLPNDKSDDNGDDQPTRLAGDVIPFKKPGSNPTPPTPPTPPVREPMFGPRGLLYNAPGWKPKDK